MSISNAVPLPYYRESHLLPAPLPSIAHILSSKEILKGSEPWATRKVVGVGRHFVVKYSESNDQIEGQNLLFLEQNGLVGFAPRLYAMWKEPDGRLFLVMERLPGKTLESIWPTLREDEKDRLLTQVRKILTQIRSIPNPGVFGAIDQGHIYRIIFFTEGLISKSRLSARDNNRHSYFADFYQQQLIGALAREDRQPVFAHSDLQRKNILVEASENHRGEKEFRVSLVDWESSGWYPVYWEYFVSFLSLKWNDDWVTRLDEVVDAWPAETAMLKMIHQDLWM